MRKLLLASVAALGLSGAYGVANAQQADDSGQATTSAANGAVTGLTQAPGTLVVRLNGRVYTQGGLLQSPGLMNNSYYYNNQTGTASETPFIQGVTTGGSLTAPTVLPQFFGTAAQAAQLGLTGKVAVQAAQPSINKLANYGIYTYARLYPGFDGIAANGLMYGASFEIRQDGNWSAGGNAGQNASISAQTARQGLLYVRTAFGYVGSPQFGIIRMGGTFGPSSLYMVGNNENFGDGGWNGSMAAYLPTQAWIYWPFADDGNLYATQKIEYLSPAFAGFDFGVSFSPNTAGSNGAAANQGCNAPNAFDAGGTAGTIANGVGVPGSGCAQLSSTNTADYTRYRNEVDVAARYRGLFGPLGFAAYVNYIGSSRITDNYPVAHQQVDGYSIGAGGAQVTYGGLTIGAMGNGGRYSNAGSFNLAPKNGPDATAYEVGGSYTWGPFVAGLHWFSTWSAAGSGPEFNPDGTPTGAPASLGQRRERGVAVGGTYSVAPGLALNLTYIWGERLQNGHDFLTEQSSYAASVVNTTGCPAISATATKACLHNMVNAQGLFVGASLTW